LEPPPKKRRRVQVKEEEKTNLDDKIDASLRWCTVGVREFEVGAGCA